MILILGAIIGLLMVFFNIPLGSLIAAVFFITLGCLYFYLGFALLNNIPFGYVFKADSYKGLGPERIIIAIGTGIAISILTIGIMFFLLNYPMARTMLDVGIVFVIIIIISVIIKNAQRKNLFYRNIILRCMIFLTIAVIFLLLPGHLFEKL